MNPMMAFALVVPPAASSRCACWSTIAPIVRSPAATESAAASSVSSGVLFVTKYESSLATSNGVSV